MLVLPVSSPIPRVSAAASIAVPPWAPLSEYRSSFSSCERDLIEYHGIGSVQSDQEVGFLVGALLEVLFQAETLLVQVDCLLVPHRGRGEEL